MHDHLPMNVLVMMLKLGQGGAYRVFLLIDFKYLNSHKGWLNYDRAKGTMQHNPERAIRPQPAVVNSASERNRRETSTLHDHLSMNV